MGSRSATPCTMRSARVLSLPMAASVDQDAEASEEALEELRMDMAQLLLLLVARSQGKSATMLQDKFPDRNARMCQDRNVRMSLVKNVRMCRGNSAEMSPSKSPGSNVGTSPGKSAITWQGKFPDRNVPKFLAKCATMCQDKPAQMCLAKNVAT